MADVRFSDDEIMEVLTLLVNHMADEAGFNDKDRAMLKRWRSGSMRLGSDDMDDLVVKANDDFAKTLERRQRSHLRKPDWSD